MILVTDSDIGFDLGKGYDDSILPSRQRLTRAMSTTASTPILLGGKHVTWGLSMLEFFTWVLGYILTIVISVPVYGLLISLMWGWFVAPVLGTRPISVAEGIGLALFFSVAGSVATAHLNKLTVEGETDVRRMAAKGLGQIIGIGIAGPIVAIVLGWAWHTLAISN